MGDSKLIKIKMDFRSREIEQREIRDGNKLLLQWRNNIINLDGTVEYGEWDTSGTIANYGDCFDERPSFFKRLFNLA